MGKFEFCTIYNVRTLGGSYYILANSIEEAMRISREYAISKNMPKDLLDVDKIEAINKVLKKKS